MRQSVHFQLKTGLALWLCLVVDGCRKPPANDLNIAGQAGPATVPSALVAPGEFKSIPSARDAWDFDELTTEEQAELADLIKAFRQNPAERHEILERLSDSYSGRQLVPFVQEVLAMNDEELSLAAIEMLSGNTSEPSCRRWKTRSLLLTRRFVLPPPLLPSM